MLNKNVCPNCGQLYDTELSKCPLCGTAPQVVDAADPVQRKRITEAERKQRRASRKEAEQEAKRRRKDAQFMQDADEERLLEEEEARRKEEKRRLKEEKRAARHPEAVAASEDEAYDPADEPPVFTPAPARDGRGPMPDADQAPDRRRIPRIFLILSTVALGLALLVGGTYLLWKTGAVKIPFYDDLAGKSETQPAETLPADPAGSQEAVVPPITRPRDGREVPCSGITLEKDSLQFDAVGDQAVISVTLNPSDTTDALSFVSSDPAVAKVSSVGIVTAMSPGTAVITVTCGEHSAQCSVNCEAGPGGESSTPAVEVTELELNKNDMTFFAVGENYVLSVINVPAGTPVTWESLDESICTVDAGGHVVAVGPGTTRVFATVGDLETYCWVRCKLE